jgi:uncharacterized protein
VPLQVCLLSTYDPDDHEANLDLLTARILYGANVASGRGNALDYENNSIFENNASGNQSDVPVCAPEAAARSRGEKREVRIDTPLDRCKDIEVGSEATVYATLTSHAKHDNFYGQILRISEDSNDPEAEKPTFDVYSPGSTDAEA